MITPNVGPVPVTVENPGANFSIPTPVILELYDHSAAKISSVTAYYSIDRSANMANLWIPPLSGLTTGAGAMTIKGLAGADIPALIQLSAWVASIDVIVISDTTKYAGTVGKSTDGVFSLTRTDADFTSGKAGGIPNAVTLTYPIPLSTPETEAEELQTAVIAQGWPNITQFVEDMKTLQDTVITTG